MYRFLYSMVAFLIILPLLSCIWGYIQSSEVRAAQLRASTSYVEAVGDVVQSEVRNKDEKFEHVYVKYKFSVDEKIFYSDTFAHVHIMRMSFSTEEALRTYAVGAKVKVFYDPLDPRESVLNRTPPNLSGFYSGLLFGLISTVAGTLLIRTDQFKSSLEKQCEQFYKQYEAARDRSV